MSDDAELLGEYAKNGSEQAFSELVRQHVDLVYGAALRRTGDSHRAAEVTQEVFTHLARQARRLTTHTALAAWLHTATRNVAINLMISEKRRRLHESEAATLARIHEPDGQTPGWDHVGPILDAAIDALPEPDRVAIVLRFLKRQSFAAVGAALRVSEDAARMRTERALDKLRTRLARQGVSSTAAAMGALVSGQTGFSAPASLAASAASTALAAAAAKTGIAFFIMTMIQKTLIATVALGLLGTLGYEANVIRVQKLRIDELTEIEELRISRSTARSAAPSTAEGPGPNRPGSTEKPALDEAKPISPMPEVQVAPGASRDADADELRRVTDRNTSQRTVEGKYNYLFGAFSNMEYASLARLKELMAQRNTAEGDASLTALRSGISRGTPDYLVRVSEATSTYDSAIAQVLGDRTSEFQDLVSLSGQMALIEGPATISVDLAFYNVSINNADKLRLAALMKRIGIDQESPEYKRLLMEPLDPVTGNIPIFDRLNSEAAAILTPAQIEVMKSWQNDLVARQRMYGIRKP